MKLYELTVKDSVKSLYWPEYLRYGEGFITEHDSNHVYMKFIRTDDNGKLYLSATTRYLRGDVYLNPFFDNEDVAMEEAIDVSTYEFLKECFTMYQGELISRTELMFAIGMYQIANYGNIQE